MSENMEALTKQIELLAAEELNCANANFPQFASKHEGYAVLLEEVEESADEMEAIMEQTAYLWNKIKNDSDTTGEIEAIRRHATRLAAEAVQVIAMTDKFMEIKKKKEEGCPNMDKLADIILISFKNRYPVSKTVEQTNIVCSICGKCGKAKNNDQ